MIRVVFMGRKRQAACVLEWLISHPQVDVVAALTDFHLAGSPTAAVAENHGIPMYLYDDAQSVIDSGELQFELGVSFGYWRVVKEPMLSAPRLGIINVHPAPLPELRGRGGYNIALIEEHPEYGVTAHYMNEGVDTGPIIAGLEVPIDPKTDTALDLGERAMAAAVDLSSKAMTSTGKPEPSGSHPMKAPGLWLGGNALPPRPRWCWTSWAGTTPSSPPTVAPYRYSLHHPVNCPVDKGLDHLLPATHRCRIDVVSEDDRVAFGEAHPSGEKGFPDAIVPSCVTVFDQ